MRVGYKKGARGRKEQKQAFRNCRGIRARININKVAKINLQTISKLRIFVITKKKIKNMTKQQLLKKADMEKLLELSLQEWYKLDDYLWTLYVQHSRHTDFKYSEFMAYADKAIYNKWKKILKRSF